MINENEYIESEFDNLAGRTTSGKYVLKLYIAGLCPKSERAILNIKRICDNFLKGRYELQVIDLYQQPGLAVEEQIVAAPTLVKKLPLPLRRIIGDMSDEKKVLISLDLNRA